MDTYYKDKTNNLSLYINLTNLNDTIITIQDLIIGNNNNNNKQISFNINSLSIFEETINDDNNDEDDEDDNNSNETLYVYKEQILSLNGLDIRIQSSIGYTGYNYINFKVNNQIENIQITLKQ